MHLIQEDIQRVMVEWNCHRIRSSHHAVCPSGHPNELYFLPQIHGSYPTHSTLAQSCKVVLANPCIPQVHKIICVH